MKAMKISSMRVGVRNFKNRNTAGEVISNFKLNHENNN